MRMISTSAILALGMAFATPTRVSMSQMEEGSVSLGKCVISPIPGWNMSVYRGSPLSSVRFRKGDDNHIWIMVQVSRLPRGVTASSIQSKPAEDDLKRIRTSAGATAYFVSISHAKFDGRPAWESLESWHQAGDNMTVKTSRFVTGRDECSVSLAIKRKTGSFPAKVEQDAAWKELSRHVRCSG